MATKIKSIRLLVEHRNKLLKFCKIGISQSDASIYIIPYAPSGKYYSGTRKLMISNDKNAGYKDKFNYLGQFIGEDAPKVSIHESGQIHIYVGKDRTKALNIPKLHTLKDEHIASVTAVAFSKLLVYSKEPKLTGKDRDIIIKFGSEVESGRILIFVNGRDGMFSEKGLILTLKRKTLSSPLYYCISPVGQAQLDKDSDEGEVTTSGVMVISGWNPRMMDLGHNTEYHYLIGE